MAARDTLGTYSFAWFRLTFYRQWPESNDAIPIDSELRGVIRRRHGIRESRGLHIKSVYELGVDKTDGHQSEKCQTQVA